MAEHEEKKETQEDPITPQIEHADWAHSGMEALQSLANKGVALEEEAGAAGMNAFLGPLGAVAGFVGIMNGSQEQGPEGPIHEASGALGVAGGIGASLSALGIGGAAMTTAAPLAAAGSAGLAAGDALAQHMDANPNPAMGYGLKADGTPASGFDNAAADGDAAKNWLGGGTLGDIGGGVVAGTMGMVNGVAEGVVDLGQGIGDMFTFPEYHDAPAPPAEDQYLQWWMSTHDMQSGQYVGTPAPAQPGPAPVGSDQALTDWAKNHAEAM